MDETKKINLETFFDSSQDIMCITDFSGKFHKTNPSFISTLGYSEAELKPTSLIDFIHPEDLEKTREELVNLARGTASVNFIGRFRCKNGHYLWLLWNIIPKDQLLYATGRNVSDMKYVQEKLITSEKRFSDLSLNAPVGIFETDQNGNTTFVNTTWGQITGIQPNQALSVAWYDKVHPDDREKVVDEYQKAAKHRTELNIEFRYLHPTGPIRWVTARIKEKVDENAVTGYVGTIIDITELKLAQEKFEALNDRMTLATRSAKIGVWEWDLTKNTMIWDEILFEVYGQKRSEFSPTYEAWLKLIHPEDQLKADEQIRKALSGEKEYDSDFRIILSDGAIRYIKAFAIVQRSAGGKTLKMIGVNWDVTKEKEIDKAKSEFVSLASHQLRTPLTTISWYAEMLLAGDAGLLNPEQKKYLQEVYSGNKRMIDLVNALLNVSRIELGTFAIEPELTDFVKLAESVLSELRPLVEEKTLKIQFENQEIPLIQADPKLLRIVYQNLITNSVKYTPPQGQLKIEHKVVKRGDPVSSRSIGEDSLLIMVSDTGYGIPKEQQEKVFTKLFRAENIRQKDTRGTGLGLYIVKSIVESCGGSVWFTSEVNHGTTFYVTLPLSGMQKKEGSKHLD